MYLISDKITEEQDIGQFSFWVGVQASHEKDMEKLLGNYGIYRFLNSTCKSVFETSKVQSKHKSFYPTYGSF